MLPLRSRTWARPAWARRLRGRRRGGLELLFGFGDQALGEVFVAELGVLRGLLGGRKRGHASGAHLVELEGGLAEGGFGVGAADALEGREVGGAGGCLVWLTGLEVFAGSDMRPEFWASVSVGWSLRVWSTSRWAPAKSPRRSRATARL